MIITEKKINTDTIQYFDKDYAALSTISSEPDKLCFLDIETTGFSRINCLCYLIGIVYFTDSQPVYRQWLAEKAADEIVMINELNSFLSDKEYLITFNGETFDLPFLSKRAQFHKITFDFSHMKSLDLYKVVNKCNSLLNLSDKKQKTVENFLQIHRKDTYTGGELIEVFRHFVAFKDPKDRALLLLHNHDDIVGMLDLCSILSYSAIINGQFTCNNAYLDTVMHSNEHVRQLCVNLSLVIPIPVPLSIDNKDFSIRANEKSMTVFIPIYEAEYKFFYKDYKDYYYLPDEDKAIHKSVAVYVDSSCKVKAGKENAFTKKRGIFIKQLYDSEQPVFKCDYNSKETYIEITDSLLNNTDLLYNYCLYAIKPSCKRKADQNHIPNLCD